MNPIIGRFGWGTTTKLEVAAMQALRERGGGFNWNYGTWHGRLARAYGRHAHATLAMLQNATKRNTFRALWECSLPAAATGRECREKTRLVFRRSEGAVFAEWHGLARFGTVLGIGV
jgi:hypothetical protein